MPVLTEQQVRQIAPRATEFPALPELSILPSEIAEERPEFFSELLPAMFFRENALGSLIDAEDRDFADNPDPTFDPFKPIEGTRFEAFPEAFTFVDSDAELEATKRQIDREIELGKTIEAAPLGERLGAGLLVGLADPVFLILAGLTFGTASAAGLGLAAARTMGGAVLRGAGVSGAATFLGAAGSELVLQQTQALRTPEESLLNIGAATLLGTVLGAGLGGLAGRKLSRAAAAELGPDIVDISPAALLARRAQELRARLVITDEPSLIPKAELAAVEEALKGLPRRLSAQELKDVELSVSLLGRRVAGRELAEIEAAVKNLPGVREALARAGLSRSITRLRAILKEGEATPAALAEARQLVQGLLGVEELRSAATSSGRPLASLLPDVATVIKPRRLTVGEIQELREIVTSKAFASSFPRRILVTPKDLRADGIEPASLAEGVIDVRVLPAFEQGLALAGITRAQLRNLAQLVQKLPERVAEADLAPFQAKVDGVARDIVFRQLKAFESRLRLFPVAEKALAKSGLLGDLRTALSSGRGKATLASLRGLASDIASMAEVKAARAAGKRPLADNLKPGAQERALTLKDLAKLRETVAERPDEITQANAAEFPDEVALPPGPRPSFPEIPKGLGNVGIANSPVMEFKLKRAVGVITAASLLRFNAMIRALTSPAREVRRVVANLGRHAFIFEENALGRTSPVPVENRVMGYRAGQAKTTVGLREQYTLYRKRLGRQPKLNFKRFKEQVAEAMRNDDQHAIPEVATVSRLYRQHVFDPAKDAAIELKLLPRDVTVRTALSYLTRVYNVPKMVEQREVWRAIIVGWLRRVEPQLSAAELRSIESQIFDRIASSPAGRIIYRPVDLRGPLKARTLTIPDAEIAAFLENDIEVIARHFLRTMAPDIELTRTFGSPTMEGVMGFGDRIGGSIREAYAELISKATTPRERVRLNNRMKRDLRDIASIRDRIRSASAITKDRDGAYFRSTRVAKQGNLITILGNVVISSIPDIGRPVMTQGLVQAIRTPVGKIINRFRGLGKLNAQMRADLKEAGVTLEWILADERARTLFMIGDDIGRQTLFERGLTAASDKFGLLSLLTSWNVRMKTWTGSIVYNRVLGAVTRRAAGKASRAEIERLEASGINEDMARRIAGEFKKYGETASGVRIARTTLWDDMEAREIMHSVIRRDTESTIVTPGAGDIPIWFDEPGLSLIGQFRSFAFASVNQTMIPALQAHDMAALNGTMIMVAMGMMSFGIKQKLFGGDLPDDPVVWVAEGIDRSGLLSVISDANFFTERLTRGTIGISALSGQRLSRFAGARALQVLLGPSISQAERVFDVISSLSVGESPRSRTIERMIPFLSLFYIRGLITLMREQEQVAREREPQEAPQR